MRVLSRLFDIAVSATALVVLAPVMAVVAMAIAAGIGRPVLFRQRRPGYKGRPFIVYKFRTMSEKKDERGELLPDEERLTRLGSQIRSISLDELPQLWNVLKGEMSLVGPRPLLMQYLPRYNGFQRRRHDVRPGITGWAQIHGRNDLPWEEKFELDVWYVDNWSFWLDLRIIGLTVSSVLHRHGISRTGYATAPEFMGSETNTTATPGE